MKNITLRIEIPHKYQRLGFVGMEIHIKESGSFGVERLLKEALPNYKLGEIVEGAKVTFLETEVKEESDEISDGEVAKMNLEYGKILDEKELIHRALLGNQEAQKACTEKGIKIPCPTCGKSDCIEIMDCYTAHGGGCECQDYKKDYFKCVCSYLNGGCGTSIGVSKTKEEALEKWNTRPAPPVGRCGECRFYTVLGHCMVHSQEADQYGCGNYVEMLKTDFCSYFEPEEE